MTFHKRKSGRNLADCDAQVELPVRAREVAVLEEEVSDLPRPDWNVDLGGGAEHNARQLKQGVIDLRTSGVPRGLARGYEEVWACGIDVQRLASAGIGRRGARPKLSERIRTLARPGLVARPRELPRL